MFAVEGYFFVKDFLTKSAEKVCHTIPIGTGLLTALVILIEKIKLTINNNIDSFLNIKYFL